MVSKRIQTLCSLLQPTDVFADVGCDHGYCTEYMLTENKCQRAIFSDVSKGSLQKAEMLLGAFVAEGRAVGVLGDGFYGVPPTVGEVLIAGMGGSEILSILTDEKYGFLPKTFVFQPMLNADRLRRYVLENGVICGRRLEEGETPQRYSEQEIEFGKENLERMPTAFVERTEKQCKDIDRYLATEGLQEESRAELLARKERLLAVLACR